MSASKWRLTLSLLCVLGTCEIFANRAAIPTNQVQLDGLKDSDEDRTISNDEMERRIKTWQK